MKKIFSNLTCFFLLLTLNSCGSGSYTASPNGDSAEIELKNGKKLSGEMILISDSAIIFSSIAKSPYEKPYLFYIPDTAFKSISVKGYDGSGWAGSVILFQAIPNVLYAAAAISQIHKTSGALTISLIFTIPTIVTAVLFGVSQGDTPKWSDQSTLEDLYSLKIYSRYPEGLNEQDLNRLINSYGQKTIKKL